MDAKASGCHWYGHSRAGRDTVGAVGYHNSGWRFPRLFPRQCHTRFGLIHAMTSSHAYWLCACMFQEPKKSVASLRGAKKWNWPAAIWAAATLLANHPPMISPMAWTCCDGMECDCENCYSVTAKKNNVLWVFISDANGHILYRFYLRIARLLRSCEHSTKYLWLCLILPYCNILSYWLKPNIYTFLRADLVRTKSRISYNCILQYIYVRWRGIKKGIKLMMEKLKRNRSAFKNNVYQ